MSSSRADSPLVIDIQFTLLDKVQRLYYSHAENGDHETIDVGMPGRAYLCWIDLVIGRLRFTESGCTLIPSANSPACRTAAIYDTRRSLDTALGEGWGTTLIRSHHWGEYSLALPHTRLYVHRSIERLAGHHVSPHTIAELLDLAELRGVLVDSDSPLRRLAK